MIIVNRDNIPVACYDDVNTIEALRAFAEEDFPGANFTNILIDSEGTASLEWLGKKYDAKIYSENL